MAPAGLRHLSSIRKGATVPRKTVFVIIVRQLAVHLAAFTVRMYRGEYNNEPERFISDTLRSLVQRFTQKAQAT